MILNKKIVVFFILTLFINADTLDFNDINFNALRVNDFIKMISLITDTNISIEDEIYNQELNFISNQPIDKDNLIPLTQTILESKGMTLENTKDGYKVVQIKKIEETNTKTVLFQLSKKSDEIIPLLEECEKYEYIPNNDGFYLVITADKDILISIKKMLTAE